MSQTLKIFAIGFTPNEWKLLKGTVLLSSRREPHLELVQVDDAKSAAIILVDVMDADARAWVQDNQWIQARHVVWVDSTQTAAPGHAVVARPVMWPSLPILLTRIIEAPKSASDTPHPTPETGTTTAQKPPALAPRERRILVVDDSRAVRDHLNAFLIRNAFVVDLAEDAETALRIVLEHRYECVLLDVLMPGINGYEACRKIKDLTRNADFPKVVMLTSKSSPFDKIRGKMAGCDAYLTKPVEPERLLATLEKFDSTAQGAGSVPHAELDKPTSALSDSGLLVRRG